VRSNQQDYSALIRRMIILRLRRQGRLSRLVALAAKSPAFAGGVFATESAGNGLRLRNVATRPRIGQAVSPDVYAVGFEWSHAAKQMLLVSELVFS